MKKMKCPNCGRQAFDISKSRFGKKAIYQAVLMGDLKMPGRGVREVIMPGVMYQ